MRPRWISLLALAAGAALPLAFAPFAIAPLAIILPALFLALLPERRPRRALGLGYLFGLGCFGVGVSWVHISIHVFGGTPLVAAILVAALTLVAAALVGACVRVISKIRLHRKIQAAAQAADAESEMSSDHQIEALAATIEDAVSRLLCAGSLCGAWRDAAATGRRTLLAPR